MQLIVSAILGLVVIFATLGAVTFLVLLERKVAAWIQDRLGPNRVGPYGLLQTVADAIKLTFKEGFIPGEADKLLFLLGPALAMFGALATLAAVPFGGMLKLPWFEYAVRVQIAPNLDVGVVYVLIVSIASVYGVLLGGWASNSKYSFFGALRSVAQILSYEIPLGICILSTFLLFSDLRLEVAVQRQVEHGWLILYQPAVFLIMFTCFFAETNRLPFDTPEAEQELVVGYHTEYSALQFGFYFLGEYAHLIAASALLVTFFFGGWHLPLVTPSVEGGIIQTILKLLVFSAKILVLIFIFMWARWTLPRFRFDQVLRLCWTGLLPITLALLLVTGVLVYFNRGWTVWLTLANAAVLVGAFVWVYLTERRAPRVPPDQAVNLRPDSRQVEV